MMKKRVLGRILGQRERKSQGLAENYLMRIFMNYILNQVLG
jgi:hypothetical protein